MLRFVSNLVLAHALFPEAFAIVAYASIVLQGLAMLSDFGMGPAIVRSARGNEPDFLNTAWTVQVIRGIVLFLCSIPIGWPIAWFYGEPQLVWIIPACALSFVCGGFQSTNVQTCRRDLMVGRVVLFGVIESVLKAVITIGWALLWPSVWALVGGALISYVFGAILTHTMLPGIRNRFCWDRTAVRELMGFGSWIMLSTLLTFLAGQADRLILGKLVAMHVVGVYSIALMFARLPFEVSSRLADVVLFPVLANIARNNRDSLRANLLQSRDAILALSQLGVVVVALVSPWFFGFFYDARYVDAVYFAPFLAGTVWFAILWGCSYPALLAVGDARMIAFSNFANLVLTVVGCLVGYQLDQMRGFMTGVGVGNLAGSMVVSWALARHKLSVVAQDLKYTVLVAMPCCISFALPSYVDELNATGWRVALTALGISGSAGFAWWRLRALAGKALRNLLQRIG